MQISTVSGFLISLIVIYVIITLFFYWYQPKLLFHPWRDIEATPEVCALPFESHMVAAADGVRVHVWYVPRENNRGVVLFSHGNAGNMSTRLETVEIIHNLGFSVCMYDYRGYGDSEGVPSELGMYADVAAVYSFLIDRGIVDDDIVVWGRSLGAAVSSWCAAHYKPRALILESGFTSIPDMAQAVYPYLPARVLSRYDYATIEHVANVVCPVLVVHSRDDRLVPYEQGRSVFDAIAGEKTFCDISGQHGDGYITSGDVYIQGVDRFLKKCGL